MLNMGLPALSLAEAPRMAGLKVRLHWVHPYEMDEMMLPLRSKGEI